MSNAINQNGTGLEQQVSNFPFKILSLILLQNVHVFSQLKKILIS